MTGGGGGGGGGGVWLCTADQVRVKQPTLKIPVQILLEFPIQTAELECTAKTSVLF